MTICNQCGLDHQNQLTDYPIGTSVRIITRTHSQMFTHDLAAGDIGLVVDHCDDGRAIIHFEKTGGTHTFHQPTEFFVIHAKVVPEGKTILQALKEVSGLRVSNGDKWLVINADGEFVVYYRPYQAKKTRVLVATTNEQEAVAVLIGEDYEPDN